MACRKTHRPEGWSKKSIRKMLAQKRKEARKIEDWTDEANLTAEKAAIVKEL